MTESIFLIFGLGFFLFCAYIVIHENRREERRTDQRADLEYTRQLNERREFGYETVEEANRNKPRRLFGK